MADFGWPIADWESGYKWLVLIGYFVILLIWLERMLKANTGRSVRFDPPI
jgi:hypothetical protein